MVEKREREKNECCEFQETKSTSINHGNNQGMVTFVSCLLFDDNNNQEHKRRRKKKIFRKQNLPRATTFKRECASKECKQEHEKHG